MRSGSEVFRDNIGRTWPEAPRVPARLGGGGAGLAGEVLAGAPRRNSAAWGWAVQKPQQSRGLGHVPSGPRHLQAGCRRLSLLPGTKEGLPGQERLVSQWAQEDHTSQGAGG